jgi:ATP-binding cassette, subfamily G (WHITE), member 8 (sterolin 2)
MDIFDTFFLVEYLRQWAARGRIVMLSIHPPTYEIFTMLSRVALISSGRLMYCGRRREMLPYFAFIEFPCPAYKNPSDYYRKMAPLVEDAATSPTGGTHSSWSVEFVGLVRN